MDARVKPGHDRPKMSSPTNTTHTNRLASATSPYLLQHQHNPVDWWQWGPEALAEAKRSNRPIMLSVGYAACHWCHVMAHESFEDDGDRGGDERAVRQHQGRPRGAAGHRPDLHERAASAGRAGRLAADHVSDAGRRAGVGRHLFSEGSRNSAGRLSPICCARCRGMFREEPQKIEQNRAALLARLADKARPGRQGGVRHRRAGRRRQADRQCLRCGAWRPARRAEISAAVDSGNAVAGRGAHAATRGSSRPSSIRSNA